jgi:hypothetical protein
MGHDTPTAHHAHLVGDIGVGQIDVDTSDEH